MEENEKLVCEELTGRIIESAITVHKTRGPGFSERIYEKALCIELARAKVPYKNQFSQAKSYLAGSKLRVALVLNFGKPTLQIKRVVL